MVNRQVPRRTDRHSRGASAVEFALLLPVLIMLLFGIIQFGLAYNARNTVTHAAREGARAAAVDEGSLSTATRVVERVAPNLRGMSVSVSPSPECDPGEPFTVTVSYDHDYDIPLFGSGTFTIVEQGTMRCGG